jgi:hypothetical protein
MVNKWVEHIRAFAKKNGQSYGCALSDPKCKSSYHDAKGVPALETPMRTSRVIKANPPNPAEQKERDKKVKIAQMERQLKSYNDELDDEDRRMSGQRREFQEDQRRRLKIELRKLKAK